MKQIYIESYYRNGYSRFMKYINNVLDHPKRETIEQRLEIIKFFDDYGPKLLREPSAKVALPSSSGNRNWKSPAVSYLL